MQTIYQKIPAEYRELATEFATWYVHAKPGDRFIYYFGEHLHENMASEYLKKYVWDYATEGKVYIFQTRDTIERTKFNFIAMKPKLKLKQLIPLREAAEKRR